MKKSNFIVLGISAVAAALLLALWYYLGFNHIDNPLDLVLAIVWWAGIVAIAVVIARLERQRQRRIKQGIGTVAVGFQRAEGEDAGILGFAGEHLERKRVQRLAVGDGKGQIEGQTVVVVAQQDAERTVRFGQHIGELTRFIAELGNAHDMRGFAVAVCDGQVAVLEELFQIGAQRRIFFDLIGQRMEQAAQLLGGAGDGNFVFHGRIAVFGFHVAALLNVQRGGEIGQRDQIRVGQLAEGFGGLCQLVA